MDGACTRFLCVPTGSGVAHLRRIEACIEVAPSGRRPSNVLRVGARRLAARIGRLVTVGRTVGVAGALEVATPGLVVATAESREQRAPLRLNRATSSAPRPRISALFLAWVVSSNYEMFAKFIRE